MERERKIRKLSANSISGICCQAFQIKVLTAFLEAGEAFVLGQSAASAGRLTGRTGQFIEATQRAEL